MVGKMENKIYILKDESRIPELVSLFKLGLGETTEAHWKWRLFTPNTWPTPEVIVTENDKGDLIGMATTIPVIYGDNEYRAVQLCDWVVHPDYRGQGMIGKLYRFLYAHYEARGFDFLMAFPNDNSYPIFVKYQYKDQESPDCWNTSQHIYVPFLQKKYAASDGYSFQVTDSCPIDQTLLQKPGRQYRTSAFLRWKYDENPDTDYKWLTIWKNEEVRGYFVFTQTHGRVRTAVNIYDWEYELTDAAAFQNAINMLRTFGNYVSFWGKYGEAAEKLLHHAGLVRRSAGNKLVLKAMSEKGYPEQLNLTRIDTDF